MSHHHHHHTNADHKAESLDTVISIWNAGRAGTGNAGHVYVATLDVVHGDDAIAQKFHGNAWLYFNRAGAAPAPWKELTPAEVIRPLRWQPLTSPAYTFAAIFPGDDEVKRELDRVIGELRVLAHHVGAPESFKFRIRLAKLLSEVEGKPIVPVTVTEVKESKTRVFEPAAMTDGAAAPTPSTTGEKKLGETKEEREKYIKEAGDSFDHAVNLTAAEAQLLAAFIASVSDITDSKEIDHKLEEAVQSNEGFNFAFRKIATSDVAGHIYQPSKPEAPVQPVHEMKTAIPIAVPEGKSRIFEAAAMTAPPVSAIVTPSPAGNPDLVQTRRIVGGNPPAMPTPQIYWVNKQELPTRLATTTYQWHPVYMMSPRMQTIKGFFGEGVPNPENMGPTDIFGKWPTLKVVYYSFFFTATRDLDTYKRFEDVPKRNGLGNRPDWSSDIWFERQRLEGCNASMIKRVTKLPESIAKGLQQSEIVFRWEAGRATKEQEKLEDLVTSNNLYMVDYSNTFLYAQNSVKSQLPRVNLRACTEYLPAPIALFRRVPIAPGSYTFEVEAIQVESDTNIYRDSNIVYLRDPKNGMTWRYAKTALQTADWNYHEIGSHLALTHLVSEVFAISTHRNFGKQHPLYQLLVPHFVNTIPLNYFARSTLVPKTVGLLSPLEATGSTRFAQYLFEHVWNIRGANAEEELRARGFEPKDLDTQYPTYYEARDSLKLWTYLKEFVATIVAASYDNAEGENDSIKNDIELQGWVKELQEKFGGKGDEKFPNITTIAVLVDTLTTIIYTASVKHSAVNYLQEYYWSYMPNAPPFLRLEAPTVTVLKTVSLGDLDKHFEAHLIGSLPDRAADDAQNAVVTTLSQPPPTEFSLQDYATECDAGIIRWMNVARKTLGAKLAAYDAAINTQGRPEPQYNILKSAVTASSIRI